MDGPVTLLPAKLPKKAKRSTRWRSGPHRDFVREHACCVCGSTTNIAAAHVRLGSHTGMGQKPNDWRIVGLCDGPHANNEGQLGCHNRQHIIGEETFWRNAEIDPEAMIKAYCDASPKRADIRRAQEERNEQ